MNKEFTQICKEILALGDTIKNSGLNEQFIAGSVEEAKQIKEQIEKIRDQILAHSGEGGANQENLNEIKNELNLKLSIATAEALYATKSELPNISGLLSNEKAETTYLKIESADAKFATKEELVSASLGGGDNSAAIEQLQSSINAKLGKDEAEGIYAKISQIPNTEGLLSTQTADDTYLKKVDKPNIDNLATKAELENYATKEQIPDVSSFITQTQGDQRYKLKGQGGGDASIDTENFLQKSEAENIYAKKDAVELLESGKLGKSEKAADSALFNGNNEEVFVKHADTSETATASSVVKRTADGSIEATNLNVSGNINLAGTAAEDGTMVASSHIVFVENDSKALRRGNINKLKQLVAPDLSGYALKTELPNVSSYQTQSQADNRYALKTALTNFISEAQADEKYALKGQGGLTATVNKAAKGYIKFSNGVIFQWGTTYLYARHDAPLQHSHQIDKVKTVFPIAFPNRLSWVSLNLMPENHDADFSSQLVVSTHVSPASELYTPIISKTHFVVKVAQDFGDNFKNGLARANPSISNYTQDKPLLIYFFAVGY